MFYPVHATVLLKLSAGERRSIVRNNGTRQSMCRKRLSQSQDGRRCGCRRHDMRVDVLRICVYNHQDHIALERTHVVDVQSIPRFAWPFPWMQVCARWKFAMLLTSLTTAHFQFNVSIKSRPPQIATCQCLHAHNARVAFMKLL